MRMILKMSMRKERRMNEKDPRNNEDEVENNDKKGLDGFKCYPSGIML